MIEVVNLDKFSSELACALLGTNTFNPKVVKIPLGQGKYSVYDHLAGHTFISGADMVAEKLSGPLTLYLSHVKLDRNIDKVDGFETYDLIQKVMQDNVTFDNDFHYHLIPKNILDMAFNNIGYILSDPFAYAGWCKRKNSNGEFFRDNEHVVRINKTDEMAFLAFFYGAKCFIFVRTAKSQCADVMLKLSNPWQFNKYFAGKKVIEGSNW